MSAPLRVRLSPALHALVRCAGGTTSAGVRALLLLGAASAGYDLGGTERELRLLLAEDLETLTARALQGLLDGRRTSVGQPAYTRPTPPEPESPGDPLLGVGIEV